MSLRRGFGRISLLWGTFSLYTTSSWFLKIEGLTKTKMEKNTYSLRSFKPEGPVQEVKFYKLNEDGSAEHGTTLEEMLSVCIERLKELNGRFSSRENAVAITKMQEALMWLNERTRERNARGVEGKHIA